MLDREVIIIGGGLGGLFCGAILSKEGKKVTVIEKNRQLGGGMQSFYRNGAVFDTDMHVITSMFKGGSVYRLCNYLGILDDIHVETVDKGVSDTIYLADENAIYEISAGRNGFRESILKYFPEEKESVEAYMNAIEAITNEMDLFMLRGSKQKFLPENRDYFLQVGEFISKYVRNRKLGNLLAYTNTLYAGDRNITPAYLHAVVSFLLQKGVSRFKGGTFRFIEILRKFIISYGGSVITGEGISEIVTRGKRIEYLKSDKGNIFTADRYISSLHPASLHDMFKGKETLSVNYFSILQGTEDSDSAFILNIKFKERAFPYLNRTCYYFENAESVWSKNSGGKIEKFLFTTPPLLGQDDYARTMCITVPMEWKEVEKWENSSSGHRPQEYYKWKKVMAGRILDKMELLYPDIRRTIELVDTASPLTIRDFTGVRHGAMCGYRKDVNNIATVHLPVRTRIENLLLTGQNVNIHGFCGVVLTALQTSEEILGHNYIIDKVNE